MASLTDLDTFNKLHISSRSTEASNAESTIRSQPDKKANHPSSCSSPDVPFTNRERESGRLRSYKVEQCTSKWTIFDLENQFRVFYVEKSIPLPSILDMVYEQTGMFGPLTSKEQKDFVKRIQDHIKFSYFFSDLVNNDLYYFIEETKNGLKDADQEQLFPSLAQDFIESTVFLLIYYEKLKKSSIPRPIREIPEHIFRDLFMVFVKMCRLRPIAGEAWRAEFEVLRRHFTSTCDIVIMASDICKSLSVVSIVEIKNRLGNAKIKEKIDKIPKKKPVRKTSSSSVSNTSNYFSKSSNTSDSEEPNFSCSSGMEKVLHEEPEIYKRIKKDVLAQHGGELMGHVYGHEFINPKNFNELHPGIIVIGTKVTFTLLVYDFNHLKELKNEAVVKEGRSYIYYSEPKDMMKKEDRDQLFEAFVRLGNRNR